jgi:hypothetical protein
MANVTIEVEGLKELIDKLDKMPAEVQQAMNKTMLTSLNVLQENVPPYIAQVVPPEVYRRTGTLGRTLGSSQAGGKAGRPTVYGVYSNMSGTELVGEFGTNLSYAPYVIDPERQAYMHKPGYKGRPGWWTMDTIKEKAEAKINELWNKMVAAVIRKLRL